MTSWQTFHHRNLWQHSLWSNLQELIGRKTWKLEESGAQALVIRHPLPLGLCWLEVPRGPLFESESALEAILKKIRALAKKEGAVFVRLSSYQKLPAPSSQLPTAFEDKHPETSLVINLQQTEEEILSQMKPKGRYNIKVAQKNKVEVQVANDIDAFYDILKKTGGRDGFGIHGKNYYQKMLEALGSNAQLLVAKYEGKVIAGGIFVYLDEWGIYYYGASDHEYRKFMAPYLIQWEAMKEAKKRGCLFYDFLGIAPEGVSNHPWAGVTDFKKKFGGQVVNYPQAKDMVVRRFWYFVYHVSKRVRR